MEDIPYVVDDIIAATPHKAQLAYDVSIQLGEIGLTRTLPITQTSAPFFMNVSEMHFPMTFAPPVTTVILFVNILSSYSDIIVPKSCYNIRRQVCKRREVLTFVREKDIIILLILHGGMICGT